MHQEMQIRSAASTDIMTEVTRPKRTLTRKGRKRKATVSEREAKE